MDVGAVQNEGKEGKTNQRVRRETTSEGVQRECPVGEGWLVTRERGEEWIEASPGKVGGAESPTVSKSVYRDGR